MSTKIYSFRFQSEIELLSALRQLLHGVGDTQHLLHSAELTRRLDVLDKLDALLGALDLRGPQVFSDPELILRAESLRCQFEAVNETLYEAARSEIAIRGYSPTLNGWLTKLVDDEEAGRPHLGIGFNLLDEIVSGVLRFRRPDEVSLHFMIVSWKLLL